MFTVTQIRSVLSLTGSEMNLQGYFTCDEIRAALCRSTGKKVNGVQLTVFLNSAFERAPVQGYYKVFA